MDLRIFQASKISLFNLLNTDYTTYTLFIIISDPLRVLLKLIKPYLIFVILPLMEAGVARGCYDHFSFSNRENLKHDRLDINLIIDRGSIWSNPSYVLGIGSPPKKSQYFRIRLYDSDLNALSALFLLSDCSVTAN